MSKRLRRAKPFGLLMGLRCPPDSAMGAPSMSKGLPFFLLPILVRYGWKAALATRAYVAAEQLAEPPRMNSGRPPRLSISVNESRADDLALGLVLSIAR